MKTDTIILLRKCGWKMNGLGRRILLPLLMLFFAPVFAQTPEELFLKGNELYRKGQFEAALKQYNAVVSQGYESSELYFNTGNAYFRLNKIAPAILAYERALRTNPGDLDVEHNLKLANLRTVDRIDPVPELFVFQWFSFLGDLISPQTATTAFAFSWSILFVSLSILSILKRISLLSLTRRIVVVALLGVLVSGGFMGIHSWEVSTRSGQAVITASVVTAKSSPDENGSDAFVIHEGLKVRMSDNVGGWKKITLPDGKVGWVRSEHCESI